jgi:hypothetical protein
MGTTLTGTTPATTYDSLIKVTDNGPLSGTAKYLSDGLGNDSALAVSTTAVGIGTSSPAGKLHISGDGAAANLIRLQNTGAGTNGFFDISVTSTEAQVIANYSTTAIPMLFLTGAAERLRITSTGNVGIGTSSPNTKLDVNGTINVRNNGYEFGRITTNNVSGVDGGLTFQYITGGVFTNGLLLDAAGNVGIGTSSPASKLDVNQTNQSGDNDFIRLTTDATSGSLSLGIYPSSGNSLSFIGSNALFSSGGVTRLNAGAGGSLLSMNTDSIVVYVSSGAANPVERMRIDSSGNVGIGTTAPSNFEGVTFGDSILDVNGVIQVRGDATNGNALVQFGGSTYRKALMFSSVGTDVGYLGVAIAANGTDSSSTEVARFTPNGLTFNGDTAAANALDDYEEGTWTMGVSFGGASVGVTYGVQGGTYTKIGRQVTVNGFIILSSKGSSTGAASITGLPFTSGNDSGNNSSASLWLFNVSFANQFQGIGDQNATTITLYETTEAGTVTTLEDTNFANDSRISVGLTYFV